MDAIQETINDIDVMTARAMKAQRPADFQLLEYGRYMGLVMARESLVRNKNKATLERLKEKHNAVD